MPTRSLSLQPGTALGLIALFFALGGSAYAVGERIHSPSVAQQRCTNGAVRGVAYVTGTSAGMGTFPIGSPAPATSSHASSTAPARPFRCAASRQESSRCGSSGSRAPAP